MYVYLEVTMVPGGMFVSFVVCTQRR